MEVQSLDLSENLTLVDGVIVIFLDKIIKQNNVFSNILDCMIPLMSKLLIKVKISPLLQYSHLQDCVVILYFSYDVVLRLDL